MSILRISAVTLALSILGLTACQNKADQGNSVSPNLITNPVTASGKKVKSDLPVMEFEQVSHDFGTVVQGEKVSYTFKFTNTGGSDLVISNASATCGCTVPTWSKEPVKPGDQGSVEVVFSSSGQSGSVSKSVNILTNTQPNTVQLRVSAEVYVPTNKK
jgi:hypothetical protein